MNREKFNEIYEFLHQDRENLLDLIKQDMNCNELDNEWLSKEFINKSQVFSYVLAVLLVLTVLIGKRRPKPCVNSCKQKTMIKKWFGLGANNYSENYCRAYTRKVLNSPQLNSTCRNVVLTKKEMCSKSKSKKHPLLDLNA